MFTHFKNIDTAFQHIKRFSIVWLLVSTTLSAFVIYLAFDKIQAIQEKIYILANGKAIEAFTAERKDNIPVELRDHIKMFHHYFFTLDPDEKVIRENMEKALNLADESAANAYADLKEKGYYNNIISANISQTIQVDSIELDMDQYPFYFRCYALQKLTRSTSAITRSLISQGYARNVSRSDNNSHGLLIQRWEVLTNEQQPNK